MLVRNRIMFAANLLFTIKVPLFRFHNSIRENALSISRICGTEFMLDILLYVTASSFHSSLFWTFSKFEILGQLASLPALHDSQSGKTPKADQPPSGMATLFLTLTFSTFLEIEIVFITTAANNQVLTLLRLLKTTWGVCCL